MEEIVFPRPKLHVFVCTNDRTGIAGDAKPSCGPRMKSEDVKEVKAWLVSQGLASVVYCTQAKCLGFCNADGSVACVYPSGKFYRGIQSAEDIKALVRDHLGMH